ncbi:glutamate--tRNA ligase [Candidatus Nitrosotenuis sp. DW1]|uniref:glutamate--tRNA ligase n=1 Tax=Candidatus Nitrosotenuis sp. DW1 TaxID=2259672 RepID=UPI0015CE0B88|nr:glutamate--tRNA ligase [Candidatus Nitrosotenuis sp. DW1]QLH08367.1 glutamate--tRNA ligase [Candidatus Nitrosotenuis sp. DW1]
MDDSVKEKIRKLALQNAVEHEGKTQDKIILSKALGTIPELRKIVKEITPIISDIVNSINQIPFEQQKSEIAKEFPDLLVEKPKKEEREGLPPLDGAEQGKVITRFPPEPNGYPHIGHAKAAIIDEEYARMYGGKLILRFDDTNPEAERLEYWAAIKVGLDWLGVKYDMVKNTSDDMELLYKKCLELINGGFAYLCTCKQETVSANRREMKACKCSLGDLEQNLERWEKMFSKYKQGEVIVRFRGDMKSENTVMRDPVMCRIIEAKHPIHADKYRVWPSYDFSVAIEDSIDGVTHAFRTKEYELRNELYYAILDALKMRKPKVIEFSRLGFEGMPVSKRILRPLIEECKVSGYDDPRLPTLEALKRRGITPEAIRKFVLSLGFTKADTLAPFDTLESLNRKIVDADSIRLHMVKNPAKMKISGMPNVITLPNHPTKDIGTREIILDENLYIESEDIKNLKTGDELRLMGLGNVQITKTEPLEGKYAGEELKQQIPKVQWVVQKDAQKIKILIPSQLFIGEQFNEKSLEEIDVFVESYYSQLKEGKEIQFVRFGYCRKDSVLQAIYTHK